MTGFREGSGTYSRPIDVIDPAPIARSAKGVVDLALVIAVGDPVQGAGRLTISARHNAAKLQSSITNHM
jgi:hypothetical protein